MRLLVRKLELFLRFALVYPLLRALFHNPVLNGPVSLEKVRKILILRYDRIGDIIVTTPVIEALRNAAPHIVIGVFASAANSGLIRHNAHVNHIYVVSNNWIALVREILRARKERYDVVLNFIFNRTTSGGILANLIAPRGIKIGQGADHYGFYFNRLLKLDRGQRHMVDVLFEYVETVFGRRLRRADVRMRIILVPGDTLRAREFLNRNGLKARDQGTPGFAVVNISATDDVRKISHAQALGIVDAIRNCGLPVVLISSPTDNAWRVSVAKHFGTSDVLAFPPEGTADLREVAALVGSAALVVTPDTAIVHVASAMQTPIIGLFTPLQVSAEWLPFGVPNKVVMAEQNQPVREITVERVAEEIRKFTRGGSIL